MASNLGPLTTTFTPPASCFDVSIFYRNANTDAVKILDAPACLPTNYLTSGYYSPGFHCPEGYQASTESSGAETSLNCCPNQFQYQGPWPGTCFSMDLSTTFNVLVTAASPATTVTTEAYSKAPATIWADAIQVRYKSSDLVSSTTLSTSDTFATSLSSQTPSQSAQSDITTSGLSTGAKVGIGVAVPIACLALGIVAFLLYRRRAAHPKTTKTNSRPEPIEMADNQIVEMPAASNGEIATVPGRKEGGEPTIAELEAPEQYK